MAVVHFGEFFLLLISIKLTMQQLAGYRGAIASNKANTRPHQWRWLRSVSSCTMKTTQPSFERWDSVYLLPHGKDRN